MLKKLSKLKPLLRRFAPALLITAIFAAPGLLFTDFDFGSKTPSTPPVTSTDSGNPRVDIDPFRQRGAFAVRQADVDRATWSWGRAKTLAATVWESQLPETGVYQGFYCGCNIYRRKGGTGGEVDFNSCGYSPRKSQSRAARLEWEHVVPASFIGKGLSCWDHGAPECVDKSGSPFKGRSCCYIADPAFIMAASDPVNLAPAIGEINGDRVNYFFDIIPGGERNYGQCDFKVDGQSKTAQPSPHRRGDIARIYAYMSKAYGLKIPRDKAELYSQWMLDDPVSAEEVRINQAIAREGHRPNPFVMGTHNQPNHSNQ